MPQAFFFGSYLMRATGFLLAILCLCMPVHAAQLPPSAEKEISQLLNALGSSGCQFNRNGSWYKATDAQAHLTKKYDYLRKKEKLASTEDFIVMAGTQSSSSGEAYQVQCGAQPAMPSATWLREQLGRLRAAGPATK